MYILRYLKVVVFNRRIYCSWSEIKLGKSIVYFSPICWGDSTFKRGCLFCFSITTSNMLEFTPFFLVTWGRRPKIDGLWKWFFGCHGLFEFGYPSDVENAGPKKKLIFQPLCFFGAILVSGFQCAIIYGSGFCICSCFFQPYPPKIPAQAEEKAENIQLPPVPQGRNWRNWWIFGSPDR